MDQPEDRSAWPQGALVRAGRAATRPGRQRPQASARQDCLMGWNRNDRALRQSTRITVISGISGAIAAVSWLSAPSRFVSKYPGRGETEHMVEFRKAPVDNERVSPHKHRIADY